MNQRNWMFAALVSFGAASCTWDGDLHESVIDAGASSKGLEEACAPARGWPLAEYDVQGTAHNPNERCIGPDNVDALTVEWVFDSADADRPVLAMHATPVVDAAGNAYVGDFKGSFFSVSANGTQRWAFSADAPTPELAALVGGGGPAPTSAPFIGGAAIATNEPYVIVGDVNGRIYARHRDTGAEIWTARDLESNPLGGISGNSISIVGDMVLVGFSSLENYAFVLASAGMRVDCCSHRGELVALDLATGAVRWRFDTIAAVAQTLPPSQAPFVLGPSGADIWSQPTYDPATNRVFVSTGQNLSPDAQGQSTTTSDAIFAIDARDGSLVWVRQFTSGDVWAVGVPNPNPVTGQPVDMDIGDSPRVFRYRGRTLVGAGQKDGRYHAVDAMTGEVVRSVQVVAPRNDLGGFQTGGACAYGLAFQHGLDATDGFSDCKTGACAFEGYDGVVVALAGDGSREQWRVRIPHSPLVAGLAVANHLVYFQSPVEEAVPRTDAPAWALYAVDAHSGAVKKRMVFPGRAIGSPVVADGHVYVTTGNLALTSWGTVPFGSLVRLGVPSCEGEDD